MSARILTATCGLTMPLAGEPCARHPLHRGYCRSAYDMGHAREHKRLSYVPTMRDVTRPRRVLPMV